MRCRARLRPESGGGCRSRVRHPPCRALAPGAQDGCAVCPDLYPAGWGAPRQALPLERKARAVAPVGAIPLPGYRAVPQGRSLPCGAPDHIVTRIELEPLCRKAFRPLSAGGAKRRDDGVDPVVFMGGTDPTRAIDRVRRYSTPVVSVGTPRPSTATRNAAIPSFPRHRCAIRGAERARPKRRQNQTIGKAAVPLGADPHVETRSPLRRQLAGRSCPKSTGPRSRSPLPSAAGSIRSAAADDKRGTALIHFSKRPEVEPVLQKTSFPKRT